MSDDIWDSFPSGDFVKFATIGDTVSGTVTGIRVGEDFNGRPCPVIDLATADGPRTVTCGQANLSAQIKAMRPKVGTALTITYTSEAKAEKGMKKVFTITAAAGSEPAPF